MMDPLTRDDIHAAFTPKQRRHVTPPDLGGRDWPTLDYLGWAHVSGHMAYVVYAREGETRGLVLRRTKLTGQMKPKMCSWCLTVHQGSNVNLFTAQVGDNRDKLYGDYMCNDLKCSAYVRGTAKLEACQMRETISLDMKIVRLRANVERFYRAIYGQDVFPGPT
ncbi:MAG: FBP domain-containing protein [Proteobacteria bacterium]|nr:FBP domain-containing protein [Pseudomonadota bacterium]